MLKIVDESSKFKERHERHIKKVQIEFLEANKHLKLNINWIGLAADQTLQKDFVNLTI